jgi:mono/diheme cytochrome c family protein
MTNTRLFGPAVLLLLAQSVPGLAADEEITYAKHIAPIFQAKCQECHQPDSIAPVSFMTYQDVLKEARSIKQKVEDRVMPPWHIDPSVGIQAFKNNRGLTDDEIDMIVSWIDAEAPFGDRADLPPPREFPDPASWQLGMQYGSDRWSTPG